MVFNHLFYVFWIPLIVNTYSFEKKSGLIKTACVFLTMLDTSMGPSVRPPTPAAAPAPNSYMTLSMFLKFSSFLFSSLSIKWG